MAMQVFHDWAMVWVLPQHSGKETFAILLRWVHFLAGITWVGLLYFFNLVNVPFMKQVDAATKPKVFQYLTLPALNWFRWSALLTVFVGFWYWAQVYVGPDAHLAGKSGWGTIGLFLLIWIVAWHIFFAIVRRTPNPWLLAVIVAMLMSAAAWLFVNFTPVGGDDNHVLSIGIGGGFGFFMVFNVWGIIWPNNKKIIQGTLAGTPPANAAVLARQAFLASRTNFYLSIPMLFFMAASSHYPIFGK
jgi:uncharacterized membrane protein